MVNRIKKWMEGYERIVFYYRCRKAIKRANRRAITTGKKQLVMIYGGKPVVMSKQHLKKIIKEGAFVKGFTPEKAEALAIHKTA